MYQVWMTCPTCGRAWVKDVYGVDALEDALDDPVEVCPDCDALFLASLENIRTEEEWRQELPTAEEWERECERMPF